MFKPEIRHDVPLIPVVGDAFCFPYLVDLAVKKGIRGLSGLRFDVFDDIGGSLLRVNGKLWEFKQKKRIVSDPSGAFPILAMHAKVIALRNVWEVYRGESSDAKDLMYTVEEYKPLQSNIRLDVFMAGNRGRICNFHVKGSSTSQNFKVYKGDTLIAEVKDKIKIGHFLKGIKKFDVRIYPGADYAFIVSLLVILNDIYEGS